MLLPTLFFLVLFSLTHAAVTSLNSRADCTDVHIFLIKGNNEPYPGRLGALETAICSGLSSCGYENVQYTNPEDANYCDSVTQGTTNGISQITAYNSACPKSSLVVAGYSQGAQVVGDILGGGGGTFYGPCIQQTSTPLDHTSAAAKQIVAIVVFGDDRHTANQPYNYESGSGLNGYVPRPADQLAVLDNYSTRFRNYCVSTDPVCAGGDDISTHLNYLDVFADSAAAWVKQMVQSGSDATSSLITSGTSSAVTPTNFAATTTQEETTLGSSTLFSTTTSSSLGTASSSPDSRSHDISSSSSLTTTLDPTSSVKSSAPSASSITTTASASATPSASRGAVAITLHFLHWLSFVVVGALFL